ncbi:MAG: alanine racemase [Acidimicrobiales bacterium]
MTPLAAPGWRQAWAEVDAAAAQANAAYVAQLVAPAQLCAVVKADGYGHGALAVARAALAGGASCLAVALVEEGVALRQAGIEAPILILSEPCPEAMVEVARFGLTPTIYTQAGLEALVAASSEGTSRGDGLGPIPVQVKVDTGMHRVGLARADLVAMAQAVAQAPGLALEGVWTHLAVADEPANDFTATQLDRFAEARADLEAAGVSVRLFHAANSAGALAHPGARLDMVRCGIALYGYAPSGELAPAWAAELRPVLSLRARVSLVKTVAAGEGISYGLTYRPNLDTVVATVPLGYADGVPRRLSSTGGEVLIGGKRCRLAGTVTMDQVMVDCGPKAEVAVGDEVVFIGRQGSECIGADDWASRLGTIAYEILCGIGARVPRVTTHVTGSV